jgi:hypothetical protein
VRKRKHLLQPRPQVFHPTFIIWGSKDHNDDCIITINDIQFYLLYRHVCLSVSPFQAQHEPR